MPTVAHKDDAGRAGAQEGDLSEQGAAGGQDDLMGREGDAPKMGPPAGL